MMFKGVQTSYNKARRDLGVRLAWTNELLRWNYHGLGNPRIVYVLKDLEARFKPNFIFLMEVEVN